MKKITRITFLLLCLTAFAGGPEGENWPNFRGSGFDGTHHQAGLFEKGFGLEISWKKELGSGYSSVSLADGIAVTMFSDGTDDFMIGLAAKSGNELWRYRIAATYKGHSGSHDGTLSTPVIDGNRVFGLAGFGHMFALDLKTGKKIWTQHLAEDLDGKAQTYGFASSPLVVGNVLVVQGGGENSAVSGLDKNTGKRLWTTGQDVVSYQSPVLVNLLGKQQLICPGDNKMFGIDPGNGKLLWEYKHEGKNGSYHPVMAGNDSIFLRPANEGLMLRVSREGETYHFKESWKSSELKNTSNVTVYHKGYLYGFSGRFLTCIDAKTGARMWRSRPPGDGFTILVENHLVLITKRGSLHLIEATPESYREKSSIAAFDSLTWTPPSFAYGKVFVRSLTHIAAVDVGREKEQIAVAKQEHGILPKTEFAAWLGKLAGAADKKAMVDRFMKAQKSFPVIEKERYVHIIYRGDAEDVGITGDHFEVGTEHVLNPVPGTDLSYYSFELAPDAHISYQLAINYEDPGPDPLNQNKAEGFQGMYALLGMPRWSDVDHQAKATVHGKLVAHEHESKITGGKRKIQIYLPPGYGDNDNRFPVLYVNYGSFAIDKGAFPTTLDNVIGKTVEPLIAVFVDLNPANNFGELAEENGKKYIRMLAEELVPYMDTNYRTRAEPGARAVLGASSAGYISLLTGLTRGDVFSMAASQSANLAGAREQEIADLIGNTTQTPVRFVLEWGRYDTRGTEADVDFPGKNAAVVKLLRGKGIRVDGGEQPLGRSRDRAIELP